MGFITINMIPQIYKTYMSRSVNDISVIFLILNLIGLLLCIIYVVIKDIYIITILLSIYFITVLILLIMIYIYSVKNNTEEFI